MQQALDLIAEAKRTGATKLDLGNCGLTELPEALFELTWLEELILGEEWLEVDKNRNGLLLFHTKSRGNKNNLEYLSPRIGALKHLKNLSFESFSFSDKSKVADLWPLKGLLNLQCLYFHGTPVSDISPLNGLQNLQYLYFHDTSVSDISPLKDLQNLQFLSFNNTPVSDISPLNGLQNLQFLSFNNTPVSDISPLKDLLNLQYLSCENTSVSDINPLKGIDKLQRINLSHTQVSDLSPLKELIINGIPIKIESGVDQGIFVENCPLDKALIAAIKKGPEAAQRYFHKPKVPLYEARVLLLGEPRAGKTTLRRKLKDPNAPMPAPTESTKAFEVEIDPYTCNIEKDGAKQKMTYHLWDFGGQDYYRLLHQLFVSEQSVYVIVTDTDRNKNEEEIDFWLETIQRLGKSRSGDYGPVLLLQNPKTGREGSDFWDLKKRYPFWQQPDRFVINLSALSKTETGFDPRELEQFKRFKSALEQSFCRLEHVGKELPADWVKVRKALLKFEKDNWITTEKFYEVCREKDITDPEEIGDLLDIFHTLGYALHYKNTALKGMVILKREWATDALYRVLDDDTVRKNEGWFRRDDARKIWFEPQYENRSAELLALMEEFKLSYFHQASGKYIVPAKLPEDDENLPEWNVDKNVRLHLQYDWLPRAIPIQLMVSLHDHIAPFELDRQWIWRRGAVLDGRNFDLNDVQVRIFDNWRENKIEISARGTHSEHLIRSLMAAWRRVNEPFEEKVKVQKQILCACEVCRSAVRPFLFEYEDVLNAIDKDGFQYCNKSGNKFKGRDILKGLFDDSTITMDLFEKQAPGLNKELLNLIADDKIDEALDKLMENEDNAWVIPIKRRYTALRAAQVAGVISFEEQSRERNKVVGELLSFLQNKLLRIQWMTHNTDPWRNPVPWELSE